MCLDTISYFTIRLNGIAFLRSKWRSSHMKKLQIIPGCDVDWLILNIRPYDRYELAEIVFGNEKCTQM